MDNAESAGNATRAQGSGSHAFLVASGILLSRISGLVRERVFAHYFGNSAAAGAFRAAFRIANYLQNLFGEGVLSASFIPVYAGLLARGDDEEAGRVAGAIGSLLALVTSVLVVVCIVLAPYLIYVIAPGFEADTRDLTIRLLRILLPGIGILVLSAWCLGILNSHRKFFLSYSAPVVMNVVMIAALVAFGASEEQSRLAVVLSWAAVIGSAAVFAVQLPVALRLAKRLQLSLDTTSQHVRTVMRNFGPVFISRGVVQISAFVDSMLATLISDSAIAALGYAQTIYILPVSLFGMSVSAAELPAMSSATGDKTEIAEYLRGRLDAGLRQIAFFIVPSAMAFLALGDVVAGALYQSGEFKRADTLWIWGILAGSTVGLLASTLGRLYSSTYYALHDTRTPLKFAMLRVALGSILGFTIALNAPVWLGIDPKWGVAGLTMSSGFSGWVEFALLRRTMNSRIGKTGLPASYILRLWASAAVGAAAAWGVKLAIGVAHPIPSAAAILAVYGAGYFGAAALLGIPEVRTAIARIRRMTGSRG